MTGISNFNKVCARAASRSNHLSWLFFKAAINSNAREAGDKSKARNMLYDNCMY